MANVYTAMSLIRMLCRCHVRVLDEGEALPQKFDNYIYLRAERGEHTTDGFRKLRIIHSPEYYSIKQCKEEKLAHAVKMSAEHGYMSSTKWLAASPSSTSHLPLKQTIKTGLGTQGPSHILDQDGSCVDFVRCFYVKTWPKEAESWLTRQTHWPDRTLKSQIRKIGYLLVPIGNRKSQESELEWRCSFSLAEKILFQSLVNFQRCTFFMLKVILKEYLPSDINTDGDKQLLSTYHIKTLFLWCLEDSQIKWELEDMLGNIGHMLDKLLRWINQQYFPHYFIPSVKLLDGRQLHSRATPLISVISDIRNDLSSKIKRSPLFIHQKINFALASTGMLENNIIFMFIHHYVMHCITGKLQMLILTKVFENIYCRELKLSLSVLLDNLVSLKPDVDLHVQHFYRAIYSDPVHDKLLMKAVPGLTKQYSGSIHMAKYCMAARDGRIVSGVLHTAESLLAETLHLDPCSGYVKLACLYIATGNFVHAKDRLHSAENNFLFIHKKMMTSALRNLQLGEEVDLACEVFQKWTEGQFTSDIVVTWPEYITVPDLLQFELILLCTQQVIDVPDKHGEMPSKMVALDCHLQWPPLSLIKLLKFVCVLYSGRFSISHMGNLLADLIASSLSLTVLLGLNDIYTVFNMAAWCYVKIKKYKPASCMMMVAIETCSETEIMKRCAFSYHFTAYVLAHCLL